MKPSSSEKRKDVNMNYIVSCGDVFERLMMWWSLKQCSRVSKVHIKIHKYSFGQICRLAPLSSQMAVRCTPSSIILNGPWFPGVINQCLSSARQ